MSVNSKMTAIADPIRTLSGETGKMGLDAMAGHLGDTVAEVSEQHSLIAQIKTALEGKATNGDDTDIVLQEKTVSPSTTQQVVTSDPGYDGLSKVTVNAMPTTTQATPSITVSSSGLITAEATQNAGYVDGGTKSATKQLTTQVAKTVTPSTSEQTAVASGVYTTGAVKVAAIQTETKTVTPSAITQNVTPTSGKYLSKVTVNGDSNLVPSNIRSGATIFGVAGTHEGGITPSGTIEIKSNGTHDVTNYASAVVSVPTGGGSFPSVITAGDTPILAPAAFATAYSTEAWGNSGLSITLTKNGTYRLKYGGAGGYGGGSIALYDGSTQIANTSKTLGRHVTESYSIDYTISDGKSHTISVWGDADNDSRPIGICGPVACINWDNGA